MADKNTADTRSKVMDENVVQEFKGKLRGELIQVGDANYNEARKVWNGLIDKRPSLIVCCTGVADVIESVNFARTHKLLAAVRGGGHNVSGNAVCDDGIVIDLSLMNGVWVDPKKRTARVGGGATWGDLDRETQVFGLATPGGVVSTTGVAGLTLGGGIGYLRNKYGLTIDNLLSVDIVTADGQFLQASEQENADLFWGIRGGGGNFGIAASFEFKLHPVGQIVMFALAAYPVGNSVTILRAWRDFMANAPREVSSHAAFMTLPADENFPPQTHNKKVIILDAVYAGTVEEGEHILLPLRELAEPVVDLSSPMPFTIGQSVFDSFFPKSELLSYWKSIYLKNLDDEVIDAIVARAVDRPSSKTLVPIWQLGGAIKDVGAEETAFGNRSAPFLLSIDTMWIDPKESDEQIAWARKFWNDMKPYSTEGVYLNFPGQFEEGDTMIRNTFGKNYDRLVDLKNKYDPDNLFRLNQNIKPQ